MAVNTMYGIVVCKGPSSRTRLNPFSNQPSCGALDSLPLPTLY
jgi:hypothetical protein